MSAIVKPNFPQRWKYVLKYVDKAGIAVEAMGSLQGSNDAVFKYVTKKYRKRATNGLFTSLVVSELREGDSVPIGSTSPIADAVTRELGGTVPYTVPKDPPIVFDAKPCFIGIWYR